MLVVSFLSLGFRTGVIVALSVPLVLAIVFVIMSVMGIDLNRITLGALIIALGLLVDDAIIAIEMMMVKMEEGWDRASAAAAAWDITAFPMLTGTLVTAAGFIPVGFAASAVAEYSGGIFWVVAISLLVSWIVAVLFTPYLGVKLLPDVALHAADRDTYDKPSYRRFRAIVDGIVRHRRKAVAATAAIFVASVLGFLNVQQQFFPLSERPELFLQMNLPEGSSIEATTAAVSEAEDLLAEDPDVIHATSYVGQGSVRFWIGLNPVLPNPAFAEIVILSKDTEARERIKTRLEGAIANGALTGARTRVTRFNFGPPVGHPVQFRVLGHDPDVVRAIAEDARAAMARHPHVVEPHLQWTERTPAIRLTVDQDRARAPWPGNTGRGRKSSNFDFWPSRHRDARRQRPGDHRRPLGGKGSAGRRPACRSDNRDAGRASNLACPGRTGRAFFRGPDPLAAQPRHHDRRARRHHRRCASASGLE